MKRTALASILTVFFTCTLAFCAGTVTAQEGWEKTVTLPSGEKILDMRGEWDVVYEFYGRDSWVHEVFSIPKNILLITQEGDTFRAVQQIGGERFPKGTERIKGELDKDGFKEVQICILSESNWTPVKGEISEHGNKVVFDDEDRFRATLTRR